MPKELPYEIDAKILIFDILKNPHEIPYHSRPFMWSRRTYVEPVVLDALREYREDNKISLGTISVFTGGKMYAISDAQHRLTTYALMYYNLCCLTNRKKNIRSICRYGFDEDEDESMNDDDRFLLEEYDWHHLPNIRSVYTADLEALGNIINDKPFPPKKERMSSIYDAYEAITEVLSNEDNLPITDRNAFRMFLLEHTHGDRERIRDWGFGMKRFNAQNNYKVPVPPVYLLKNAFTRVSGRDTCIAIHDAFQEWETQVGGGTSMDQFIHIIANLFVGEWLRVDEYVHAIEQFLEKNSTKGFRDFSKLVEKGLRIREWMMRHQLMQLVTRLASGHEVRDYCLFPLLMAADTPEEIDPFIRRLLAYGLRLPGRFSFNQLARAEALIGKDGAITALAAGKATVAATIKALDQLLLAWLGIEADFVTRFANDSYKTGAAFNKARVALLYIAEMTDKHEAALDYTVIDIDHISPKTPKKGDPTVADPELLHRIGNFTPFIGKNSATLRGNRGFGNKPYTEKRESYASSNIAMTRAIASRYATFADADIMERSHELAIQLDRLTTKELAAASV